MSVARASMLGFHSSSSDTAYGFLNGAEVEAVGVANIGLQDRTCLVLAPLFTEPIYIV